MLLLQLLIWLLLLLIILQIVLLSALVRLLLIAVVLLIIPSAADPIINIRVYHRKVHSHRHRLTMFDEHLLFGHFCISIVAHVILAQAVDKMSVAPPEVLATKHPVSSDPQEAQKYRHITWRARTRQPGWIIQWD